MDIEVMNGMIGRLELLPIPSMQNLGTKQAKDGIRQMIEDLEKLAKDDGNIAAAWALEVLVHRYAHEVE